MKDEKIGRWSRRDFMRGVTLAGTAGFVGLRPVQADAEPPPETTKLRLYQAVSICQAPAYVAAEELLPSEGFHDVQYVKKGAGPGIYAAVASGEIDIAMTFVGPLIIRVDAGDPIVFLSGGHVGCFELIATDRVRAILDLKGKSVEVSGLGSPSHVFIASMASYVGLDAGKDIHWATHPQSEAVQLLIQGKIDAFLAFPPETQELRAKKIGHVVVNSAGDRPWSQYFCCTVVGNREFVRRNPIATKRAVRAILKANQICALEPARAARFLVDKGFARRYDYALQLMKDLPYGRWQEYDPEDTIRFYALRLHEAGMIKSSPQKIIAEGTDWRFLNELKKELKG